MEVEVINSRRVFERCPHTSEATWRIWLGRHAREQPVRDPGKGEVGVFLLCALPLRSRSIFFLYHAA